jgi:hypothetical protein
MPITAGTGEMLKVPIAEGTLAAVGTGATADTLARRGIILYYKLCISHSRDSWDINSRKSIGNSMVDSSTRDNWIRECPQQKERKNCLRTSSRRDVKNSDSLKCSIYKYYSKRWDDSNLRIISNSRNLSNSRHANNSRDVNIRKNVISVGNTNIRRDINSSRSGSNSRDISHSRNSRDFNSSKNISNSRVDSSNKLPAAGTSGILATEGTPATVEYQEHRTSNSSKNASNSGGGSYQGMLAPAKWLLMQ